jgi:iron complex transport system ATP-binding protein
MSNSILSFHQVRFGYDQKTHPLFDGLDLSLKKGSVTAILGPNGAGKSTLLYLALGWLKSWKGIIRLSNKPVESYSRRALGQEMAFIPQNEHIPFEYTVLEYVLLGRTPYLPPLGMPTQLDEEKAYAALEKVSAAYLYDHSILAISGGERQLVLLARALAQEPRLLLLDEPSSHLDLSNKYRLLQIIKNLQANGTTILMTTHEPDFALAVSEYAVLMKKGRILFSGPLAEIATTENLSSIYGIPVKVLMMEGKKQVIWN